MKWKIEGRAVALDGYLYIFGTLVILIQKVETSQLQCEGWSLPSNVSNRCICGDTISELIRCDNYTLKFSVIDCIAITYDSKLQKLLAGQTPFTCKNFLLDNGTKEYSANVSAKCFTEKFCDPNNRKGFLCGECKPGFGVPVYSYDMRCVHCSGRKVEWLKYIAMAYIPVTVFYAILALFRISVTSGSLNAFIMVSQILSSPQQIRQFINSDSRLSNHHLNRFTALLFTFFSIWNLDFFRLYYDPFCIDPSLTTLDILLLEYLIAVYPLVLILLTYTVVKMHDRHPCIVWICSPLRKFSTRLIADWNIKNSMIGYFSTFMILSYLKILYTSIDLLASTNVYNTTGSIVTRVSYYDGSLKLFNGKHIPYGTVALFMMITFNLCPFLLLLCYPSPCFQKILNFAKCHSHFLHILMDSFQGCYTHEKHDFRYLAAVNIALRVLNVAVLLKLLDRSYYTIMAMILISYILVIAIFKPYKRDHHGYLAISALLALSYTYLMAPHSEGHRNQLNFTVYPALICTSYIFVQGVTSLLYSVCPKRVFTNTKVYVNKFISKIRKHGNLEDSLPYRLEQREEQSLRYLL